MSASEPRSGERAGGPRSRGDSAVAATGATMVAVGVVLAAAGVLVGLDRAVDLPVDVGGLLAAWWPLIVVAVGARRLARGWAGGGVVTLLGLALLVVTSGGVGWLIDTLPEQNLLAPLLLIAVGLAVLLAGLVGGRWRRRAATRWGGGRRGETGDDRSAVAVFSDAEVVLDEHAPEPGTRLRATSVFGEARVVVPAGVAVHLQETVIFGEIEAPAAPVSPTGHVAVEALVVFGEVKIQRR